jgi:hypothetical protein
MSIGLPMNYFVKKLIGLVPTALIFCTIGCGLSKKEEKTTSTGEQLLGVSIQLDGDLLGLDFWEGGFDVFAVGENSSSEVVPFADGSKRSKVTLKHAFISGDERKAIGLLNFDLPGSATNWRLEIDSIVGRSCEFSPASGSVAAIPTKNPPKEANGETSLLLQDANFTINATCTTSYKISGTVDMPVENLEITMNGKAFKVTSSGEPAAFSFIYDGDVSYASAKDSSTIKGNAEIFWKEGGLNASDVKIADYTLSAKNTDGKSCTVNPSANRFEESAVMSNGYSGLGPVVPPPPYVKIFNRLGAVEVKCKDEPTLTLSGSVTDLHGSLVLKTLAGESLTVTTTAKETKEFAFTSKIVANAPYEVTIETQPEHQDCTITAGGTGTPTANVDSIAVSCAYKNYAIGGNVTGQSGALLLSVGGKTINVGASDTTYNANDLPALSAYEVTVSSQPAGQTCTVASAGNIASLVDNVTNAHVSCVTNYLLGGDVSGLTSGTLKLRNQITLQVIDVTADGPYRFSNVSNGDDYDIRIILQPATITCDWDDETKATGILNSNVTDIGITCM